MAGAWIDLPSYPTFEPPPPRPERPGRGRPGTVWVEGRWDWQHGNWMWVPGRWEQERPGKRWQAGRWSAAATASVDRGRLDRRRDYPTGVPAWPRPASAGGPRHGASVDGRWEAARQLGLARGPVLRALGKRGHHAARRYDVAATAGTRSPPPDQAPPPPRAGDAATSAPGYIWGRGHHSGATGDVWARSRGRLRQRWVEAGHDRYAGSPDTRSSPGDVGGAGRPRPRPSRRGARVRRRDHSGGRARQTHQPSPHARVRKTRPGADSRAPSLGCRG
ncbi:MAG: YXWGXW repeat-containing protein [Kofleriaceae bacterium]|nr:YXWGXW repeat-containing protein [Kofleriaceae bacterium]